MIASPRPRRATASERAYCELKAMLLWGDVGAGRVDIQTLADGLRLSLTPVREALTRLAAERLIHSTPGQGYAIIPPTHQALTDLYAWSDHLSRLALTKTLDHARGAPALVAPPLSLDAPNEASVQYARAVSLFLLEIARAQSNAELADKIGQANDRLFRTRRSELQLFPAAPSALSGLEELWRAGDRPGLADALAHFHGQRMERVGELADLVTAGMTPALR